MKISYVLIASIFLISINLAGAAAVPQLIGLTGRLINPSTGNPYAGSLSITFSIHDSLIGGNQVWTEPQTVTLDNNGFFNVLLGSVNPLPTLSDPLYLQLQIGSETLSPRQRIASSAFALRSATTDAVSGTANYISKFSSASSLSNSAIYESGGNIGIGTENPNTSLHVVSNNLDNPIATFKHSGDDGFIVVDSSDDNSGEPSSVLFSRGGNPKWRVGGVYASDVFGIGTSRSLNDQRLVIKNTGEVGIGTPNPRALLHLSGGDTLIDGGGYNFAPPGGLSADLAFFRGGTATDGIFVVKRFGPDYTIFQINSPPVSLGALEATLALVRGDEPNLELVDFYNNGYPQETQYGIRMIKRGTGQFRDFVFDYFDGSSLSEVMRIKPSGRVGIGTADPVTKLNVIGDVNWTGTLQDGSVPWSQLTNPSVFFATESGTYSPVCGTGNFDPNPITGLTLSLNKSSILDIAYSGVLFSAGGATFTRIFLDGSIISGLGGHTENSPGQWGQASNIVVVNVSAGTHTVQVRLYCTNIGDRTNGDGFLRVIAYSQ